MLPPFNLEVQHKYYFLFIIVKSFSGVPIAVIACFLFWHLLPFLPVFPFLILPLALLFPLFFPSALYFPA